ncbi:hypothetical protein DPMN_025776 [Dreissena polymorpha]|uniref:Uncharacterized protein n=1 Tax=Dreissena polymorpha TaxID=45954 RepID=A0A9D4RBY8_DREPO|nr:hypothetical protein DPMN_025776 [Dreissena polymorpha]
MQSITCLILSSHSASFDNAFQAFRPLGDVDVNGNPTVTVAIQSVTVRSGLLTQAEVLNRLALRDDGLYLTGPVSAGLVFAVSLRATDNPANTNQNTRYIVECLVNILLFRKKTFTINVPNNVTYFYRRKLL